MPDEDDIPAQPEQAGVLSDCKHLRRIGNRAGTSCLDCSTKWDASGNPCVVGTNAHQYDQHAAGATQGLNAKARQQAGAREQAGQFVEALRVGTEEPDDQLDAIATLLRDEKVYKRLIGIIAEQLAAAAHEAAQHSADLARQLAEAQKEVSDVYDAIFPYVPEAKDSNGKYLSAPDKVVLLGERAEATERERDKLHRELLQPILDGLESKQWMDETIRALWIEALRTALAEQEERKP